MEWPTIGVAIAIGCGLVGIIALHGRVPAVLTVVGLGIFGTWYGSLRHEAVHGHPTPSRWLNRLLVAAPLDLITPFWMYEDDHLRHHATDDLTDPALDPESQYLRIADWERSNPVVKAARLANTTLAGRMAVGPLFVAASVVRSLAARWRAGPDRWPIVRFVAADIAILSLLAWLGFPVWQYVAGLVYLGTSLTLVRSYAEHRAVADGSRTAVVHGGRFWALLFLNNNLHVTHHARPGLAWYLIPAVHAAGDADQVAADGAGLYQGYGEIFHRFLFHPVSQVVDPLELGPAALVS